MEQLFKFLYNFQSNYKFIYLKTWKHLWFMFKFNVEIKLVPQLNSNSDSKKTWNP